MRISFDLTDPRTDSTLSTLTDPWMTTISCQPRGEWLRFAAEVKELATMAFGAVDDVMCKVSYDTHATEEDWKEFITFFNQMERVEGLLVIAGGGQLTASQRNDVRALHDKYKFKIGVLTESRMTRGVLTALRWFGVPASAYPYNELDKAVEFLGRSHLLAELSEKVSPYVDKRVAD